MHSAPAVSYPVRRSVFHGMLIAAIAILGAMTLTAWVAQADVIQAHHLGAGMLWLVSAGLAAGHWLFTPVATLAWDGLAWTRSCGAQSEVVVPMVLLDVSDYLLLRLQTQHGDVRWAWPERRELPQRWLPFRRAVFSRIAPADALNAATNLPPDARTQVQP